MTTYQDVIDATREELMTGQPDRINVLDGNISDSTDTLTLRYPGTGIAAGSKIHIGLEELHVLSITNTGSTSTITAIRDTNATVHTAGDRVYVNPQFSDKRIAKYANVGLDELSGDGIFRMINATPITSSIAMSYDMGTLPYFISPWRVRYDEVGPANNWPLLRPDQYWIDQAADTTDFTNGTALFLRETLPTGRRILVSYKAKFAHLVNLTDDVFTTTGLHAEAHDLLSLYAAVCCLAGREVKRTFLNRQPEPRRQDEVPPGSANQAMLPLIHRYQDRLATEKKRLHRMYPGAI